MNSQAACKAIAPLLTPGCVINTGWEFDWGDIFKPKKWPRDIANWQIQRYQSRYFGKGSIDDSTHTMICLGSIGSYDAFSVFEVTVPAARWICLRDICLDDLRILRFTKRDLNDDDLDILYRAAYKIAGTKYDYGQLLDFLLHSVLGYPTKAFTLFDQGPKRKVCSTGIATLFQRLRLEREMQGDCSIPRLFDIVKTDVWRHYGVFGNIDHCLDPQAVPGNDRIRTPVERVTPAHFENTKFFQREFELVARFKNGTRLY